MIRAKISKFWKLPKFFWNRHSDFGRQLRRWKTLHGIHFWLKIPALSCTFSGKIFYMDTLILCSLGNYGSCPKIFCFNRTWKCNKSLHKKVVKELMFSHLTVHDLNSLFIVFSQIFFEVWNFCECLKIQKKFQLLVLFFEFCQFSNI